VDEVLLHGFFHSLFQKEGLIMTELYDSLKVAFPGIPDAAITSVLWISAFLILHCVKLTYKSFKGGEKITTDQVKFFESLLKLINSSEGWTSDGPTSFKACQGDGRYVRLSKPEGNFKSVTAELRDPSTYSSGWIDATPYLTRAQRRQVNKGYYRIAKEQRELARETELEKLKALVAVPVKAYDNMGCKV
jgi:hypothetical protein